MTLGGLQQGVTPLDMAHAYETFATGGKLVYGTLSPGEMHKGSLRRPGPVGIRAIGRGNGDDFHAHGAAERRARSQPHAPDAGARPRGRRPGRPRCSRASSRTARARARSSPTVEAAGKTGTTENYGDAWFVGWTREYTVAVWVGYPDEFKPMKTEFQGEPVAGGTYPAGIWRTFMEALLKLDPPKQSKDDDRRRRPSPPATDGGARRRRRARPRPRRSEPAPRGRRRDPRRRPSSPRPRSRRRRAARRAEQPAAGRSRRPTRAAPPGRPSPPELAASSGGGEPRPQPGRPRPRHASASPTAQKRHGSSAALVIPIRGPATASTPPSRAGAAPMRIGPVARSVRVEVEPDAERLGELARPRAESSARSRPRRARIASRPASGSSARISTAAPTPSGSHTALSSAWMP